MPTLTRRDLIALLLAAPAAAYAFNDDSRDWISLFDGKSLDGWKPNEHADTFKVVDGQIVVHGDRTHLFYVGSVHNADFKKEQTFLRALERNYPIFTPTEKSWLESGKILARIQADRGFEPHKLRELHFDVLIALTARSYGAKLITSNRTDFELIREYRDFELEVW